MNSQEYWKKFWISHGKKWGLQVSSVNCVSWEISTDHRPWVFPYANPTTLRGKTPFHEYPFTYYTRTTLSNTTTLHLQPLFTSLLPPSLDSSRPGTESSCLRPPRHSSRLSEGWRWVEETFLESDTVPGFEGKGQIDLHPVPRVLMNGHPGGGEVPSLEVLRQRLGAEQRGHSCSSG